MDPAANQRVAPNRVVLILALLLAIWLGFQFYPQKQPAPPPIGAVPESKLHAVRLADYTDWEGLPEFFAVWASHAEWKNDRTRFAYWHPVMKTYSYFFEATRKGGSIRFREIAEPHDPDHFWDESLGEECPIRFYLSVFVPPKTIPTNIIQDPRGSSDGPVIKLDIPKPKIPLPEPNTIPVKPANQP